MKIHYISIKITVFISLFIYLCALNSPVYAAPYILGSQDKLKIKVYEWRAASSSAYEWTALTGEFSIGAAGNLSLPLVGEVPASGKTTAELSITIADLLQQKIGLSKRPDASVEVSEYRPFYVLGLVAKPGQYPYQPGINVLQAVSTAGGIVRLTDLSLLNYERETLMSRGDLRILNAERLGLIAKRARLEAELKNADTISFPDELTGDTISPELKRITREEKLLFQARRDALKSQEEALRQSKLLISSEIETLKAKSVSLQRQLDLATKELNSVNSLVSKGLTVTSRQVAVDLSVAQVESTRLDVNLQILRSQQDSSKADRDLLDLRNKRQNEILTEMGDVRAKLSINTEKSDTSQALVYNSEVKAPQAAQAEIGTAGQKMTFTITRTVNGQAQTFVSSETDSLVPGDIIRIERKNVTVDMPKSIIIEENVTR